MNITKCDICKKEIKNKNESVVAGIAWANREFCEKCGKPIKDFLIKKKLIKK